MSSKTGITLGKLAEELNAKYDIRSVGFSVDITDENQIIENFNTFMEAIIKAKPNSLKGKYIKKVSLSSTMSPSFKLISNEYN